MFAKHWCRQLIRQWKNVIWLPTHGEPNEPEEGECLFHSQMWVKGTPLHFIVDSGIQKNLILAEVIKWMALLTMSDPQPYTIGWLCQGSDLHVSQ
jgi:hypothetical protein